MYIYVLRLNKTDKTKIGKANDIQHRIQALPYTFDLRKSFYYKVGVKSLKWEKAIHSLIESFSVDMEQADGYTEFYNCDVETVISNLFIGLSVNKQFFTDEDVLYEQNRERPNLELFNFGGDIKILRKSRGYTQQEVSDFAGVSRVTYGKIERGASDKVAAITLLKIKEMLTNP